MRLPFLGMGTTRAFFHTSGNSEALKERLYINVISVLRISNAASITKLLILSRPDDLDVLILLTFLLTS